MVFNMSYEWNKSMSLRLTIALISCISLSACATVNLDELAVQNTAPSVRTPDVNVVQRASMKLYDAFLNKGLVAKTSMKKMQSAAQVLLQGLAEKEVTTESVGYASNVSDPFVVLTDITTASRHVEQTTKAAEVYLAMAPVQKSLKKELNSLEDALLASREAQTVFEEALLKTGQSETSSEFANFKVSVDELKHVTNAFGHRVRDEYTSKMLEIN